MKINDEGLRLLKAFESCRLTAYPDVIGVWTVGYGATGEGIHEGVTWTQKQADDRLASDLEKFERGVSKCLDKPISSNQFSALVCLAYNIGLYAFETSTLVFMINEGKLDTARQQFLRWNKAGGQPIPGLTRRRQAESELFDKA